MGSNSYKKWRNKICTDIALRCIVHGAPSNNTSARTPSINGEGHWVGGSTVLAFARVKMK